MARTPCTVNGLQHCLEGAGEKTCNIDFECLNYRRFLNFHLKDLELGGLSINQLARIEDVTIAVVSQFKQLRN